MSTYERFPAQSSNPVVPTYIISGPSPVLGEVPFLVYGRRFASEEENAPCRFKQGVEKGGIKTDSPQPDSATAVSEFKSRRHCRLILMGAK
jgi:hypothetical protein